ncbi:MAG TPA: LuxR C-terminal-related transcriptional regulator [Acidimicrobiales bacterium]|nr:LuxR C-terminal-related transcriptional regulator [Acidimicrobiales bacterium]
MVGETSLSSWCGRAATSFDLREGVIDRLQSLIGFDGAFFATVDPVSLLYTSAVRRDMPAEASPAFIRTELGEPDVNQLRYLAGAPSPVGWLDAATQGRRGRSVRYREAMRPFGLGDELRVALRADGVCWGLLCLHREERGPAFTAHDADVLGRLSAYGAEGLRRTLVAEHAVHDWDPDGPGVVVVGPGHDVESATPAGSRWLAEVAELDAPALGGLPTVVRAVLDRLRRQAGEDGRLPRARVRTRSGRWLVVHASVLDGAPTSGRAALVIEPAAPATLFPIVVAAYGLTAREVEVARRALAGLARKTIAAELRLSLHTVNDHLKAIFDKVGVNSAGQLRARVFQDQQGTGAAGATPGRAR